MEALQQDNIGECGDAKGRESLPKHDVETDEEERTSTEYVVSMSSENLVRKEQGRKGNVHGKWTQKLQ